MLIYGNTPRDIRRAIVKRRWPITTALILMITMMLLIGCGTADKRQGSTMSEFFKAIGSGDISELKKRFKKSKDKEDGSWDEVENSAKKVE